LAPKKFWVGYATVGTGNQRFDWFEFAYYGRMNKLLRYLILMQENSVVAKRNKNYAFQ